MSPIPCQYMFKEKAYNNLPVGLPSCAQEHTHLLQTQVAKFYPNGQQSETLHCNKQSESHFSMAMSLRPNLEFLLSHHRIQPTIHHVIVTVIRGRRRFQFHVFFKNHVNLLRNQHVQPWSSQIWRGDIFVLCKGVEKKFVNISRKDTLFANFAVQR